MIPIEVPRNVANLEATGHILAVPVLCLPMQLKRLEKYKGWGKMCQNRSNSRTGTGEGGTQSLVVVDM